MVYTSVGIVNCSLAITITDLYATTATCTLLIHRTKKFWDSYTSIFRLRHSIVLLLICALLLESVQSGTSMRYYTDRDVQMMVGKLIRSSCVLRRLATTSASELRNASKVEWL